mmetsp:Transcript_112356/g.194868  ORF Transcript_112356/g.194868 Transcript_112356/m.194868 type:complete len:473 (+) Transcript_112356:65-1483(+)
MRSFAGFCLLSVPLPVWGSAGKCDTAGIGRAAFRDAAAVEWLDTENSRRAPYYLAQAQRMFEKGLRQQKGIDKSNNDPFIALYDAKHQVLGALDLAPNNASIWIGAGQVLLMMSTLDEDQKTVLTEATHVFAQACALDAGSLDKILAWTSKKVQGESSDLVKVKRRVGKKLEKWKETKVPQANIGKFLPVIAARQSADVCPQGAGMIKKSVDEAEAEKTSGADIQAALASMTVRPIFPTLITTTNVEKFFGKSFCKKLASIALKKFSAFSAMRKKQGQTDPNDINDAFFSQQSTGEGSIKSPRAQQFWPELYNSKEFEQLWEFVKAALFEHASRSGYALGPHERQEAHSVLWAAVYLSDGTRHGYHVHQGSFSSCVFYAQAPPGKTPIMFIDPRGAQPTNDYEQHIGERDYEPTAPFHHNYHFFAEAGDLVCFPSWLVHRVPSHFEQEPRVAFAANLQGDRLWDPWYRSATL